MNPPFWFMLAFGAIGLLRIPREKRSSLEFRIGIGGLGVALVCAAVLWIASLAGV